MPTTVEDLRIPERVARGVAWLDEHVRGWWLPDREAAIDLDGMTMSQACSCVLGQLFGDYYAAPIALDEAIEAGFDTSKGRDPLLTVEQWTAAISEEFSALTAEWGRVIEARRAGTPQ
jgi:hypothetical protein